MKEMKQILMDRDGLTAAEADDEMNAMREEMYACIEGEDFMGAEDVLLSNGFELDYLFGLLF